MRLLMMIIVALIGMSPSSAQADADAIRSGLERLFESVSPMLLFTYSVETTVTFDYHGHPLGNSQVFRCEVIHDRGTIDVRRDRVIGTTAGSASLHFVAPDGTALVLFDFNPCSWTSVPPEPDRTYELNPIAPSDKPVPDPGEAASAEVTGAIAVLDSATTPKHIEIYDLQAFTQEPAVSNFKISAKLTNALPTNSLTADIPALAPVADAAVRPIPPFGQSGRLKAGAILFQVSQLKQAFYPDDAAAEFAKFAGQKHWVVIGGELGNASGSVTISINGDPGRIDVDPDEPSPETEAGVMLPWAATKLPTTPVGTLKQWTFNICIKTDCVHVPKLIDIGGIGTSYYTLYYPPTGRMLSLSVITDDLSRLLQWMPTD